MGISFRQKEVLIVILFFLLITSVNALNTTINIDYLDAGTLGTALDNSSIRYNLTSGINWSNITELSYQAGMKIYFNVSGNAPSYTCGVYSNYTMGNTNLTKMLTYNPLWSSMICVNDSIDSSYQVMCPMWNTVTNLSAGEQTQLEFSLPRGAWLIDVRCIPQKSHEFQFNSTGIYDINGSQLNLTVAAGNLSNVTTINEGDLIIINNTDENFSNMVVAENTYTGYWGDKWTDTLPFNLSSNTSALLTVGPYSNWQDFGHATHVHRSNITVWDKKETWNLTYNSTGGRYNTNLASVAGVMLNVSMFDSITNVTVRTVDGNISDKMFINISGGSAQGAFGIMPAFDYNEIDTMTSCTGDYASNRFCENIVNFTGSCKNDTNFFFNIYENCFDNVDNDGDGGIDAKDADCFYLPGFNISAVNDTTPPKVVNTQVYSYNNISMVVIATDEASNVTMDFYGTNAGCATGGLNKSFSDASFQHGAMSGFSNVSFSTMHEINLGTQGHLGHNLTANTSYYYKIKTQDIIGNTAIGGCTNFLTTDKVFAPDLQQNLSFVAPEKTGELKNFNFTFAPDYERDILGEGGRLNQTQNATMNFTDSAKLWGFSFKGVSLLGNVSLDMAGNLTSSNPETGFVSMGVGHEKWLEIQQKLRPKEVEITMPSNSEELYKCDDDLTGCLNITNQVVRVASSTSGGGYSTWIIPTTLGFTNYRSGLSKSAAKSGSTAAAGGGGGAGGASSLLAVTINAGESKDIGVLSAESRVKIGEGGAVTFEVLGEEHSVKVLKFDRIKNKVSLEVKSTPIVIELGVNEDDTFDFNGDGVKDLSIYVNSLVASIADLTIKPMEGAGIIAAPTVEETLTKENGPQSPVKVQEKKMREEKAGGKLPQEGTSSWWLGIIAVFVIAGIGYWLFRRHHM